MNLKLTAPLWMGSATKTITPTYLGLTSGNTPTTPARTTSIQIMCGPSLLPYNAVQSIGGTAAATSTSLLPVIPGGVSSNFPLQNCVLDAGSAFPVFVVDDTVIGIVVKFTGARRMPPHPAAAAVGGACPLMSNLAAQVSPSRTASWRYPSPPPGLLLHMASTPEAVGSA